MKALPAILPNIAVQSAGALALKQYLSDHPKIDVRNWLGYWDAIQGSASTVPNLGTSLGSTTNNSDGLMRVEGPAIAFPSPHVVNVASPDSVFTTNYTPALDSSFDHRCDFVYQWSNTGLTRAIDGGWYIQLNDVGNILLSFYAVGPAFPAQTAITIANLQSIFPSFVRGDRLQIRDTFNPDSNERISYVRLPGKELDDDSGWIPIKTSTQNNQVANVSGLIRLNNGSSSGSYSYRGVIFGLYMRFNGVVTHHIDGKCIPTNTAATSFTDSVGRTWTISRATSGPCTTIVPVGKTVFINPDNTNVNNYLSAPDHADWDINHTWGHFSFSGDNANYLSVPDAAALDITGDIEFVVKIKSEDYTHSNAQDLICKYGTTNERSYLFRMLATGGLQIITTPDGTATSQVSSQVSNPGWVDGTAYWLKATLDVDDGAGNRVVSFYRANDSEEEPTSWTAVGVPQVTAGTTSIFSGNMPVLIGQGPTLTTPVYGDIYRAIVRNGIGGTTVLDVGRHDIPAPGSTSFTCKTGQTVTVNGTVPITPRSGEDAIMFFVGQMGNQTGGTTWPQTNTGGSGGALNLRRGGDGKLSSQAISYGNINNPTGEYTPGDDDKCVHFSILRRSDNTVRRRSYNPDGSVTEHSASAIQMGSAFPTQNRILINSPGVVYSWGWNKGVDIIPTNDELDKLAELLLTNGNLP